MLDEKKIQEIRKRVTNYLNDGTITKENNPRYVDFFLTNAQQSLDVASLLFSVSTKENLKQTTGFLHFNGFLWVINASYYSMFYIARALLENKGVKMKTELSIHSLTFDAIVYYFYLNRKLEKKLIDDFAEANKEAAELLGKEKAKELIDDYHSEKEKRAKFTYELGTVALQNKAETSLKRARRFNEEIRKILEK